MNIITKRIKDLRESKDLTQKELSYILRVSPRTYSYYENGQRSIPIDVLINIANYFDVSIDYIVGRIDEKSQF